MRFWWAVAAVAVVAHCGGSSVRREPSGGDGDGSEDGGTSGSAGASGGSAGTSTGGATTSSGGRGGAGATTAGGGRVSTGGSGGDSGETGAGDGGGGVGGAAGSGGSAGEPTCDEEYLHGSTCSPDDTCELLECGAPWSFFDARACRRTECTETGTCPSGERCVPVPVLGKYDDPCSYGLDGCEHDIEGTCGCFYWEECMPLAFCIPEDEFPPSRDCPIDDPMDCGALSRAATTLASYRDGTEFMGPPYEPPPALAASVDACAMRLAEALQAECD